MLVRSRIRAAAAALAFSTCLVLSALASADADPATPNKLCTAEAEQAADGNPAAVDKCHRARIASAKARYESVVLEPKYKDPHPHSGGTTKYHESPKDRKAIFGLSNDYAAAADEAALVTCRFAALKHRGELCADWDDCVERIESGRDYCTEFAGGRPDDGIERSDLELPDKLRAARSAADRAEQAGDELARQDTVSTRIAADEAEAAAAAAARAYGWDA